jgi:hypothetical protein
MKKAPALPKYPIYIVSKGRWESRLTSKALESMNTPYYIVIEEQEYKQYKKVIDKKKILILDKKYQDEYDTCDDLGYTKSKGPGAARNFAWDHAISNGFFRHWVMDDNIRTFMRCNEGLRIPVTTGRMIWIMEDFVDRYENIYMAGPNYKMFCVPSVDLPPFGINTRIYSCNLIQNDIPYRWRGRYNEDTDLSLRILKDGFCTLQFNAFLCDKIATQAMKGGNTKEFYAAEGTMPKSQMLKDLHPDVTTVVWKYNRWHHYVDYRHYKRKNKLIRKKGYNYKKVVDEQGMKLFSLTNKKGTSVCKSTENNS